MWCCGLINVGIVEAFSNKIESGDYVGALSVLTGADKETRDYIIRYLRSSSGLDPVEALIHDALLTSSDVDRIISVADKLGYGEYARREAGKVREAGELARLVACRNSSKPFECAESVIDGSSGDRDKLAKIFLYIMRDRLGDNVEEARAFAERYGLSDIAEYLSSISIDDRELLSFIPEEIAGDVEHALESGDEHEIALVLDKYGDILKNVKVDGTTLYTILSDIPLANTLKNELKSISSMASSIQKELGKALRGEKTSITGDAMRLLNAVNYARRILDSLKPVYGILVDNPDGIRGYLDMATALSYLAMGIESCNNGNNTLCDTYLSKAVSINRGYNDVVALYKATHNTSTSDIECILRKAGVLGGGGGVKPLKRRVYSI